MTNPDPFRTYLDEVRKKLSTGMAKEHAYRGALEDLLQAAGDGVQAINDSAWVECGAPDFIVLRGATPVGYVEAKDIDTSLDDAERSAQLKRYRESLHNLILTDYLEFRWFVEGEERERARLGSVSRDGKVKSTAAGTEDLTRLLERFFAQEAPMLGTAKELAERMASLARMIRDLIIEAYGREDKEGRFHSQLAAFRETLIPDLEAEPFADMYAQTITYGLFAARVRVPGGVEFTREHAAYDLPKTNPFLRQLFYEIAGLGLPKEVSWAVDNLAHLLARADMSEVLRDFGKATKQEDPVIHFYETFLGKYNPEMKQRRGVYYTPEPVVSYIVRSIDHLLKTRFNCELGLAEPHVMILDPACGTGTFLYFVIEQIHDTIVRERGAGAWDSYVRENLLGRIFGFELLMAPYAIAHMKLALQLQELGYDFQGDERLGIYLTNSLEEPITAPELMGFAKFIADEGSAAGQVKRDLPIMVVLGNPPYYGHSANRSESARDVPKGSLFVSGWEIGRDGRASPVQREARGHLKSKLQPTFIGGLVRDYYICDGRWLRERNPKWLQDDYVKFIRWAQWRIERTGAGIVGLITNSGYLNNPTFRGMRQQLSRTFTDIFVLDLHGDFRTAPSCPDGGRDENVFDITRGVAIGILAKGGRQDERTPTVCHAGLWGSRDQAEEVQRGARVRRGKYQWLWEHDVSTTGWETVSPVEPLYLLRPHDRGLEPEYQRGWLVTEIFPVSGVGMTTARDAIVVDFEQGPLLARAAYFRDSTLSDREVCGELGIPMKKGWDVAKARQSIGRVTRLEALLQRVTYRPFDERDVLYHDSLVWRTARRVLDHALRGENLLLIWTRPMSPSYEFSVLSTRGLIDQCAVGNKSAGAGVSYAGPLYLYPPRSEGREATQGSYLRWARSLAEGGRIPNLSPVFIAAVADKLLLDFIPDGKGDLHSTFGPEDVLHYMYAVFHSPTYRERYAEFLKIDFPRLPLTSNLGLFRALAEKGEELVALHLMESPALDHLVTTFPIKGSNQVEKVRYVEETSDVSQDIGGLSVGLSRGRVYINKTQYFQGVEPEVWGFHIGGYQVLEKWLKDRKGRTLSYDDVTHYGKIVVALKETIRLMAEIDEVIPSWPME